MEEARNNFNTALELDPTDSLYYYSRGNVWMREKKYELAHKDYDKAIDLSPLVADYWHCKGLAYQEAAQSDQDTLAITMFIKSIELCM